MKLKLASLGLLALAPLAAQAELVEMQDTELAAVNGGQGQAGHGFTFNFNLTLDKMIAGLDVYKNVYGYKLSPTDWELGKESEISNPVSGRWAYKSLYFGNDQGVKYVNPYFSWGRDQNNG